MTDDTTEQIGSRVEDVEKARAMATAEDPYQRIISNARKNGLSDIVRQLEEESETEAQKAAEEYHKPDRVVSWELQKIVEKIKRDSANPVGEHPYSFLINMKAENADIILKRLRAALDVDVDNPLPGVAISLNSLNSSDKRILTDGKSESKGGGNVFPTNLGYYYAEIDTNGKELNPKAKDFMNTEAFNHSRELVKNAYGIEDRHLNPLGGWSEHSQEFVNNLKGILLLQPKQIGK